MQRRTRIQTTGRPSLLAHALKLTAIMCLGVLLSAPYEMHNAPIERIARWTTHPVGIAMLTLIGLGALFVYVATLGRDQLQRLQQTTQPSAHEEWMIDEDFTGEAARINSLYR